MQWHPCLSHFGTVFYNVICVCLRQWLFCHQLIMAIKENCKSYRLEQKSLFYEIKCFIGIISITILNEHHIISSREKNRCAVYDKTYDENLSMYLTLKLVRGIQLNDPATYRQYFKGNKVIAVYRITYTRVGTVFNESNISYITETALCRASGEEEFINKDFVETYTYR